MKKKHKMISTGVIAALVVLAIISAVITIHHGFSARDNPSAVETIVAQTARKLAVPAKAKNMKNPVAYSDAVLEQARMHWADHCAFCHGNDGRGNTEVGRNLYPKAPDMTASETQSLTDGELYYTIKNGVRLTGMPAWGVPGDADEDSWKLVYFIRHLPKMTAQEAEEMKKLNPQSPMEKMEEQEEDQFLEGNPPPSQNTSQPKHNGGKK